MAAETLEDYLRRATRNFTAPSSSVPNQIPSGASLAASATVEDNSNETASNRESSFMTDSFTFLG